MNPAHTLRTSVYNALHAVNANTMASYPSSVFANDGYNDLPLTVYDVSLGDTDSLAARTFRHVDVEINVDLFSDSRDALSDLAWNTRLAMRQICPTCTLDKFNVMSNGLVRQTQTYRGRMDIDTGIIYTT